MSNIQTIDELLTNLMAMGFDQGDCQQAIQMGKLSTNAVIDWILSGKPSASSGHLALYHQRGQHQDSAIVETNTQRFEQCATSASNNAKEKSEIQTHSSASENPTSHVVHSRFVETREERGKIREKKRQKLEKEIRLEKRDRMKAKQNILKEIESDRRAQRELKLPAQKSDDVTQSNKDATTKQDTKSAASAPKDEFCQIQIRLLDGSSVRHKFLSSQTIPDIIEFAKSKMPSSTDKSLMLLQPFPRKEFVSEGLKTLQELGLCPSCSLVVRVVSGDTGTTHQPTANASLDQDTEEIDLLSHNPSTIGPMLGRSPRFQQYSFTLPPQLPPQLSSATPLHHWPSEGGHRSGYADETAEDLPVQESENDENTNPRRLQDADIMEVSPPLNHDWGTGRNLQEVDVDMERNDDVEEEHHESDEVEDDDRDLRIRRERVMHAIENRLRHQEDRIVERSRESIHQQKVDSLLLKSLNAVMKRIGAAGTDGLSSVGNLPLPLTNRIIQKLLTMKKLNPNTIQLFRSRPLTKLKLDYYSYTTNHLLSSCKIFATLRILSLRSCTLLTDKGMEVLSSLKQLQYLDVAGCTQITDNIFEYMEDLQSICHLTLDETHITDAGMSKFLQQPKDKLTHLSVRRIQGLSERSLKSNLQSLQSLHIDETNVRELEAIMMSASNLRHLSIAGCRIYRDQFRHLSILQSTLTSLNLVGVTSLSKTSLACNDDLGDYVMENLKGMHRLQKLHVRFRHSLTQQGMKCLLGCPLTHLNLSHHRSINNDALLHVGNISSLRVLDLTNTSITDEGIHHLSPIISSLNELLLSNTAVTSQGFVKMLTASTERRSELTLLSLQLTNVGNPIVKYLNTYCPRLLTLNLRNTQVSDSGLRQLVLPHLTSLLLNDSRVRLRTQPSCYPGCPELVNVNVGNVVTSSRLESGSDEDDVMLT